MCVCVCVFPSPPRSFGRIFAKLGGCMQVDLPFALEGFFFKKVNGSTGHFHFPLYYICAQPQATQLQRRLLLAGSTAESNSAPFAASSQLHICRWTSQLLLRGSFSKRSTGQTGQTGQQVTFTFTILYMIAGRRQADATLLQKAHRVNGSTGPRANGSTGQRLTFTFTILYMTADGAMLTPPRCKKAHGV